MLLLLLLGLVPKLLELRNERLEIFEDLDSENDDEEEEIKGEGKIDFVEAEEAIDALFLALFFLFYFLFCFFVE